MHKFQCAIQPRKPVCLINCSSINLNFKERGEKKFSFLYLYITIFSPTIFKHIQWYILTLPVLFCKRSKEIGSDLKPETIKANTFMYVEGKFYKFECNFNIIQIKKPCESIFLLKAFWRISVHQYIPNTNLSLSIKVFVLSIISKNQRTLILLLLNMAYVKISFESISINKMRFGPYIFFFF